MLHRHRFVDAWDDLTQPVQAWRDQWAAPSPALAEAVLRYVGLLCPHQIVTVHKCRRTYDVD